MKLTTTTLFAFLFPVFSAFSQGLYDPSQVTLIEITFPQNNWDDLLDDLYAAGTGGRLMATVEINGEAFDSVGIRYRGGSSYDPANAKNPFNIKLDYLNNQDFQGYNVLKLSNGAKDPSWLREVLGFEIARKFLEAPQANYASVFVNGNFHGVYANVQSINSSFFEDHFFSNPDNARFECSPTYDYDNPPTTPPTGCTLGHGASLEYLGSSDLCYYPHYSIQSPTGWSDLRTLANLLKNNPQDARTQLDLDRFLWLCAYNSLLANLDSYLGASVRNYFLFKADNGHFVPVPDDANQSFARFPWVTLPSVGDPQPALSFYANLDPFLGNGNDQKPLLKAIFGNATWKRMYTAHLRTMLDELFANDWLEQRASALQALISSEVMSDNNHFYNHDEFLLNLNSTVVDSYDGADAYGILALMNARKTFLQGLPELAAAPPTIGEGLPLPSVIAPGTSVALTASISNASAAWLGYRKNLTEVFTLAPMFDDGAHGDGAAGDGIYGALAPVEAGGLQYYFYAENSAAGVFDPKKAELEFHALASSGEVAFNEIMADNDNTVADQDGEFDDWAEIYNNSAASVNLAGWFLTDDPLTLDKWAFPAGAFIDPNGFLTVWCDDDELQSGLHTTFNLSSSGEHLLLVKPNLSIADQVVFGAQNTDESLSRCPDGIGAFVVTEPSFGQSNLGVCSVNTGEVFQQFPVDVFPNPANERIMLHSKAAGAYSAALLNVLGQPVREFVLSGKTEVEMEDLATGVYFLRVRNAVVQKVIIQR